MQLERNPGSRRALDVSRVYLAGPPLGCRVRTGVRRTAPWGSLTCARDLTRPGGPHLRRGPHPRRGPHLPRAMPHGRSHGAGPGEPYCAPALTASRMKIDAGLDLGSNPDSATSKPHGFRPVPSPPNPLPPHKARIKTVPPHRWCGN